MYETILYPTDGSLHSTAATTHVQSLASAFDATVHILHIVDSTRSRLTVPSTPEREVDQSGMVGGASTEKLPEMVGGTRIGTEERRAALERQGQEVVETVSTRLAGVETVSAVETGVPYLAILQYAQQHDADLVVMGTHGRTGVERYLLGSVTENVLRRSDVPVVTVRADTELLP